MVARSSDFVIISDRIGLLSVLYYHYIRTTFIWRTIPCPQVRHLFICMEFKISLLLNVESCEELTAYKVIKVQEIPRKRDNFLINGYNCCFEIILYDVLSTREGSKLICSHERDYD